MLDGFVHQQFPPKNKIFQNDGNSEYLSYSRE